MAWMWIKITYLIVQWCHHYLMLMVFSFQINKMVNISLKPVLDLVSNKIQTQSSKIIYKQIMDLAPICNRMSHQIRMAFNLIIKNDQVIWDWLIWMLRHPRQLINWLDKIISTSNLTKKMRLPLAKISILQTVNMINRTSESHQYNNNHHKKCLLSKSMDFNNSNPENKVVHLPHNQ